MAMTLGELAERVEQATGKKLTLDDLLKKRDPKVLEALGQTQHTNKGGVYHVVDSQA